MKKIASIVVVFVTMTMHAQIVVNEMGKEYLVSFDETFQGINNGTYNGSGFSPNPNAGQVDSDGIIFKGMPNPVSIPWGGTSTTLNAASGMSAGGAKLTGFRAYDTGGNIAFGWHSMKGDFDPGEVVFKIVNNNAGNANFIRIAYTFLSYDQRKMSTDMNVFYSLDNVSYTSLPALSASSPKVAGKYWIPENLSAIISGSGFTSGDTMYLKFSVNHNGVQGGFRDDIAIDDLSVTLFDEAFLFDGTTWHPSEPGLAGLQNAVILEGGIAALHNPTILNRVTVEPGGKLDVQAGLTVNDSLFIEADETGQGQVKGVVNGTTQFQAYYNSSKPRWLNVGLPVDNTIADLKLSNNGLIRTTAESGGNPSLVNIYYYDADVLNISTGEGTWLAVPNKLEKSNKTGYSLYMGGFFGSFPMIISSIGILNSGNINTPVSQANGGYNFINNPYASGLDFNAVVNGNPNLGPTYYIYNDEIGAYISYNAASRLPAENQYISPGQAFFVQCNSTGNVSFNPSQQVLDKDLAPLAMSIPYPGLYLEIISDKGLSDHTYIGFRPDATDAFEQHLDGDKKLNPGVDVPSLYTVSGNQNFVFNHINNQFTQKSVPLNLEHSIDEDLVINAQLIGMDNTWEVILEDKLMNNTTGLDQGNYNFYHLATNNPDRFVLHFSRISIGLNEANRATEDIYAYMDNGLLNVNLPVMDGSAQLIIYDLSGKALKRQTTSGEQLVRVDLTAFPMGVYMVQVIIDDQVILNQKVLR